MKSDFCRPFSHFGSLFIVKGAHLEAFPSLWQPFNSKKWICEVNLLDEMPGSVSREVNFLDEMLGSVSREVNLLDEMPGFVSREVNSRMSP